MNKILTIIVVITFVPILSFGQIYTSDLQLDMTLSGEKKISNENAVLTFSKETGKFSLKFEKLNEPMTFKINFLKKNDLEDETHTMYVIDGDMNYGGLKVSEYETPITVNGTSYSISFSIIGMNASGGIAYYTTFYAKKK